MATQVLTAPLYEYTINAADNHLLLSPRAGVVSRWLVQLVSSAFSGSITVKARRAGTSDTSLAVPYIRLHLNGVAGDATQVSTAITGTSLILVDATEMDVDIHCTAFTSGTMALKAAPVIG